MKKIILFIVLLLMPYSVYAVNISSSIIAVRETNSNRILLSKNMNEQKLIASTTKIMTAILAIESNRLEHIVKVGNEILDIYGSNIYVELNEEILLIDLVYGLMLRSGNDAASVIATFVGNTESKFVDMMNKKAKEIGMKNTIFANPHGLDDNTKNYSTAYDMTLLIDYALNNSKFKEITTTKKWTTNSSLKTYLWHNRCELLNTNDKITSCKTGYTPLANRVLASSANNKDLSVAIFSVNNYYDYDLHNQIYEEVFNKYKIYKLLDKNNFKLDNNKITNEVYIKNSFHYPLTNEEYNNIKYKLDIVNNGKRVGYVYLYLNNELIHKEEIFQIIKKISWWQKFINLFK